MSTNDETARKARAERLHAQIDSISGQGSGETAQPPQNEGPPSEPGPVESPRDFVHRRMREMRDKKTGS
jgi:hypothetical protein